MMLKGTVFWVIMPLGDSPTCWRNILPPSSGLKRKPRKHAANSKQKPEHHIPEVQFFQ
jgi:hypothetical protein